MAYRQIIFCFIFYVTYMHKNIASEAVFIRGPKQVTPIEVQVVKFEVVHSKDNIQPLQCRAYSTQCMRNKSLENEK